MWWENFTECKFSYLPNVLFRQILNLGREEGEEEEGEEEEAKRKGIL